ncbi:SGF29 tudor-like domain-containing protein [Hysterangium stoloniferum]|nr:SGF29 tudor-like domain-containing protein [Hysterangium stoloniferum]
MDRRRTGQKRPAPSEEVQCWQNICASLDHLRSLSANPTTAEAITRVNKIIVSLSPNDDTVENSDLLKHSHKKLLNGITDIRDAAEKETKAIEEALEQVGILLALRQAPEITQQEKRVKRQRLSSPSSTPSTPLRMATPPVATAVPPRSASGIPLQPAVPFSRDPKARREALSPQLPLQANRKVAFHQPPSKTGPSHTKGDHGSNEGDPETWILAVVKKCINQDKNRYEVQDIEEQDNGQPGQSWNTTLRNLIPLPDPLAPPNSAMHPNSYEEYPVGSIVMGLYPDTSCFYRAEVVAAPGARSAIPSKNAPMYRLKFEDDDDQVRAVAAHLVVEWPGQV